MAAFVIFGKMIYRGLFSNLYIFALKAKKKMKKISLFILAVALASCSDDTGYLGGDGTDTTLLRKSVATAPNGTVITSQYRYNDDKLLEVTHSNGTSEVYSYGGDFLTEINHYTNNTLVQKEVYNYNTSGVFGAHILYDYTVSDTENNAVKSEYAYDGNNVTVTRYSGGLLSQTTPVETFAMTLTSDGDILKVVSTNKSVIYGFDLNKAPLSETSAHLATSLADLEGGAHNIATIQSSQAGVINSSYSTYIYNSAGYPDSETHTEPDGSVYTTQYTYY